MDLKKARTDLLEYRKKDINYSLNMIKSNNTVMDFWLVNSLKRELEKIEEELSSRRIKDLVDE